MTIYLKPFEKGPGRWWVLRMVAQGEYCKWYNIFPLQLMSHFRFLLYSYFHPSSSAGRREQFRTKTTTCYHMYLLPSTYTPYIITTTAIITMATSLIDNNIHLISRPGINKYRQLLIIRHFNNLNPFKLMGRLCPALVD